MTRGVGLQGQDHEVIEEGVRSFNECISELGSENLVKASPYRAKA